MSQAMSAERWEKEQDVDVLLRWIRDKTETAPVSFSPYFINRKMRLFAVACVRRLFKTLEKSQFAVLDVAEEIAEGKKGGQDFRIALRTELTYRSNSIRMVQREMLRRCSGDSSIPGHVIAAAVVGFLQDASIGDDVFLHDHPFYNAPPNRTSWYEKAADILREVMGNPLLHPNLHLSFFKPPPKNGSIVQIALGASTARVMCESCQGSGLCRRYNPRRRQSLKDGPCPRCRGDGKFGFMDSFRLGLLADAIEEFYDFDCDENHLTLDVVQKHLRSTEPHYSGCWVVDYFLGK